MNWPVGIIAKAHQKKWETANYTAQGFSPDNFHQELFEMR